MPARAVKKTVSLASDLARDTEKIARAEGKTLSAVVQDALRAARAERLKREFHPLRQYRTRKAREKGVFTEADLARYLKK
jgi:hypothetical protein